MEDEYELRDLITQIPELMIDSQDANGEYLSLRVRLPWSVENLALSQVWLRLHDTTEQEKEERERRALCF